jgi:hypothetical protein
VTFQIPTILANKILIEKQYHWNSAIMPKHYKIKYATGNCVERNDQPLSDAL